RDHQLQAARDCGQCGRRGPRVERGRLHTFNVVQIQFRDQREIVADLLAAPRQAAHVIPRRVHPLVGDIAQPSAEYGKPVTVSHATASCFFCAAPFTELWCSAWSLAKASASWTAARSRAR